MQFLRGRRCVTATAIAFVAAVVLAGCASPQARFEARLAAAGLAPEVVHGSDFDHLVVRKPGRTGEPLHVYIEGDGTPWRARALPADDPTPRMPLAFELMLRDPHEAAFLGRPCYFGVTNHLCGPLLWTSQRYSAAVVDSMAQALAALLENRPVAGAVLVGHSGGGVLAVLLGHRGGNAVAIVTIGANLDVAGWAEWHGYTPLVGSLDPTRLLPVDGDRAFVPERHYVGSGDRVVPPSLVRNYARGRGAVRVIEWPGFDHVCCWADVWPQELRTLVAQ